MERSAWPKNLSSSSKREIQELCDQNPKKLREAFDAHSQTGDDPRQPLFAGDLIVSVRRSFSSNTQSLSSGSESYEVSQVPTNACVMAGVSKGSESIKSPFKRVKTPVQRSFSSVESVKTPVRVESAKTPVRGESVETPVWTLQRSPVESVKTPVQRSPVSISWEQSLVEAATAIDEGRVDVASEILRRLSAVPNPMSNSKEKLMGYMLSALKSRVSPVEYPPPGAELFTEDHVCSVQSLYDLSYCFRHSFTAANLAILEAASEQPLINKLHVIDFDIGRERQYNHLVDELSKRQPAKQFTLKITALADSFYGEERLGMVRMELIAAAVVRGVRLVFNIVRQKLSELSRDSLGCEPDEVLAVNLAFKLCRIPDEGVSAANTRDELLRRVKELAPQVVTLVEQEMNGNTAPFPVRVEEALAYYGALLASFESKFLGNDSERATRAKEGLSRKLVNLVACEGRDRVERCEVFEEWRARMGMAGFELKPLGRHMAETMKVWRYCWRWNSGYTVKEENGGVCLGWHGRTLTVASAWR